MLGLGLAADQLVGSSAALVVVVAGFLLLLAESKKAPAIAGQRTAFSTNKVVKSTPGDALRMLTDAGQRTLWDPYLKSAMIVRKDTVRLTYDSPVAPK